ncbi:Arm DNA-binding domain-containing protein [Microbulbifer elongatus]|uniref:Arm DNA-binding domain-containing protein n=1 Tax=Microbulbifer elongatus TaxID=86173 RepID=UPI001CFE4033|nr:DUF3596 domain-containing protein [Microbulbifer elongatus]
MGNVRTRKETGTLFLDFRYRNLRCREQTTLPDTAANRTKLRKLMERIEAEILVGTFDYASYFPNSRMLEKLRSQTATLRRHGAIAPLFREFAETWYTENQIGWRESYRITIRTILDKRLLDRFGSLAVDAIEKSDLLQFRTELAAIRTRTGGNLSPSHINRHMKVLGAILTEASERFQFTNPYRGIKPLKVQKSDIDPFNLDEINSILANIRPDFRDYFTVRFFTGLRTGEIDGLRWRYVDFSRRQILVRETIVRGQMEYTKTDGSQRELDMSQPVFDALKRQQPLTGQGDYVFCNRQGRPLDHNNVTKRVWYPLLKQLDLRERRPYQCRHTAATLWLASGENPEWIARQMGHTSTEMLFRVYSRYVPNLTRQDGSAFERLLASRINLSISTTDDADDE